MAVDIIDYMVDNFNKHFQDTVKYFSIIATNGSLLTDEIILKAKTKWNIRGMQITIDGYQENHNKRKNYFQKDKNQYEFSLENIEKLLNNDVNVNCRINLDCNNMSDFPKILKDLEKFKNHRHFSVQATTLLTPTNAKKIDNYVHFNDYNNFYAETYNELFARGFYNNIQQIIPKRQLSFGMCKNQSGYLIGADGLLFKCDRDAHNLPNSIGDCKTGIIHNDRLLRFTNSEVLPECMQCQYLPLCQGGCDHYRYRNESNITPCIRVKYYKDTLMNFIHSWYQKNQLSPNQEI
jgi:uncharacterized protein